MHSEPDSPRPVATHLRLGAYGENLAAAHLRRDGMRVLDRNWRCGHGELDIVARDRGVTVFCEVKTRRSLRFGTPMQAIDDAKAARIRRLAVIWQRQRSRVPRLSDRALTRRIRRAQYGSGSLRGHRVPVGRRRRATDPAGDRRRTALTGRCDGSAPARTEPTPVAAHSGYGTGPGSSRVLGHEPAATTGRCPSPVADGAARDGSRPPADRGEPGRSTRAAVIEPVATAGRRRPGVPRRPAKTAERRRVTACGEAGCDRQTAADSRGVHNCDGASTATRPDSATAQCERSASAIDRRDSRSGIRGGSAIAAGSSAPTPAAHPRTGAWTPPPTVSDSRTGLGRNQRARSGRSGWGGGCGSGPPGSVVGRGRRRGSPWRVGLCGLRSVVSALARALRQDDRRPPGRARRFDVVCVVVGADGAVTIDHRRGVL